MAKEKMQNRQTEKPKLIYLLFKMVKGFIHFFLYEPLNVINKKVFSFSRSVNVFQLFSLKFFEHHFCNFVNISATESDY